MSRRTIIPRAAGTNSQGTWLSRGRPYHTQEFQNQQPVCFAFSLSIHAPRMYMIFITSAPRMKQRCRGERQRTGSCCCLGAGLCPQALLWVLTTALCMDSHGHCWRASGVFYGSHLSDLDRVQPCGPGLGRLYVRTSHCAQMVSMQG